MKRVRSHTHRWKVGWATFIHQNSNWISISTHHSYLCTLYGTQQNRKAETAQRRRGVGTHTYICVHGSFDSSNSNHSQKPPPILLSNSSSPIKTSTLLLLVLLHLQATSTPPPPLSSYNNLPLQVLLQSPKAVRRPSWVWEALL